MNRMFKDRSGVAALEFILVAPIFLVLILGVLEVGSLILVNQKAERAAFSIANMMSASTPALDVRINNSFDIGERLFRPFPFNTQRSGITITAINQVGTGTPQVSWQRKSRSATPSDFPASGSAAAQLSAIGLTLDPDEGVYVVEVAFDYNTLTTPTFYTQYLGGQNKSITARNIIKPRAAGLVPTGPLPTPRP